jgi:5-methyltetrahydropteroyltriglutamate--homocysteine methyltransferase
MTAASPGLISRFFVNHYYATDEMYLAALADAMRHEYRSIVEAGFVLQLDCPDLAMGRSTKWAHLTDREFRARISSHIEALNHAVAGLPPGRLRMHVCWGNYEGPHHHDVPLANIIDIILRASPAGISFEGANPRHAHEWRVFGTVKLPEDKVLIPGVIDSTTNYIEHPELVAERLGKYVSLVGRDRVVGGVDCGFAASVQGVPLVDPDIAWAKLRALVEGAALAARSAR